MIAAMCLGLFGCAFVQTAGTPVGSSVPEYRMNENVYQKLQLMEKLAKSVRDTISANFETSMPQDCQDLLNYGEVNSGVHLVWPKSRIISGPITVYCDMETDGGGWTVIQRRGKFQREVDYFYQDWNAYKKGFGNLKEDFWLGNDNIYALSNQKLYTIRFDLGSSDGSTAYANYNTFWIDDENNYYKLHVDGYSGSAGDSLSYHNGCNFTTKDRDNDLKIGNCAEIRKGAWWFKECFFSHLNGIYHKAKTPKEWEGVIWNAWKGSRESLAATEIKIRKTPSWIK